jgi:hypothetical protein
MSKKQDTGWTGKNKMPSHIPPYKTPRSASVVETRKTRTKPSPVVEVDAEEKESDSEEETQFGVVWEKMTEEQKKMAENLKTTAETETPKPIEYVGKPWRDKTRPIVLITETEETERQASDIEEGNNPLSLTVARKDVVPSGEACVGKTIMKQFEAGIFCGQVVTAEKKRGRFLYHVVYEDGDEEDLNDQEFEEGYELSNSSKTFKASATHETKDGTIL